MKLPQCTEEWFREWEVRALPSSLCHKTLQNELLKCSMIVSMLSGSLVTMAWCVLKLRMEEEASIYGG
jgi:hypothetical protein